MHILPFLYPFIWQWTLGLLLLLMCCKQRCFEHGVQIALGDLAFNSSGRKPRSKTTPFLKHQNLLLVLLSCSSLISSSYFSPSVFLKPFNIPEIQMVPPVLCTFRIVLLLLFSTLPEALLKISGGSQCLGFRYMVWQMERKTLVVSLVLSLIRCYLIWLLMA